MAEKKKPLSLNDRHNRLLLDLSASHPRKPSSIPPPSTEEVKPSKVKLQGRRRLCKASSTDVDDDVPRFSGFSDFDSTPEEEKPVYLKMEGPRRLCNISSKSEDHNDNDKNKAGLDEPNFSVLPDFDSPPLAKIDSGGGNEIRDILNELTSKLDFLSIEKKRVAKKFDSVGDSSAVVTNEVTNQEKNADLPEYTSATSSFSLSADPSNSSSDATNQSRVGDCVQNLVAEFEGENEVLSESESDNFVGKGNKTKEVGRKQNENEPKRVNGKSEPLGQSFISNIEEDDDSEDDCVVLNNKGLSKEAGRQVSRFKKEFNDSDRVDELDDYTDDFVSDDENSVTLSGPKSTYKLPGKIAKMLYPHQRDGLRWLWSLHCQGKGGILGDDMGLGKTMQICGFLVGLFNSHLIKRVLIVAPKTLLPHWIKELSAVGLSEKTREYFGTCAKARQYELQYILQDKGVLLTTYDIVRNNSKSLCGDFYYDERSEDDITWDYMILDEGHLIKNPSTQRAKSLLEIPSAHRIIISGTPIQNNLKELWALFNFCCPELLGDKTWFKDKYESAILRGNDKNASDREKRIGSTVARELRERIQPYFLRRLKSEVFREDDDTNTAKLSKKNEIIVWLRLTGCQRQLYEAFLNSELVLSAFDGSPLAALTILKKICDHPLLLTKRAAEDLLDGMDSMLNQEDLHVAEKLAMHIADVTETDDFQEKHDNISCKISFILALLNNLIPEGHNVLIFSQTRKMLNLIQESLISKGYEFLRIDGTTKASDRLKIVNDFQEGIGAPIFLLTSQVGGLGLTLTKADRVIVVDPAWNPSTDNQSVDRAYRIGQRKDVVVYRLMTCGTVEEKIYRKQIYKGGLFKTATEHKEQIRYFSQQDLRELFSLPKQGFDVSLTQQQLHEEHDHQHKMDESLKAHINFLETQGIAGVSHHSLLFSKTAPAPVVQEEEEVISRKGTTFVGNSSSSSSLEHNVDGAEYAFNPKDVKLCRKSSSPNSAGKPTETEIKERIDRLTHIFANKATVSKLPDKGERIWKQIAELNSELDKIRMAKRTEKEVIDLDDITGELQRVLNV
ncbi:hypothetical protein L1049_020102 [Liquidambar formosana]|uniref:Protein CHROMATIN REMODELING 24 n=1 Tax=Liquidambar formosana TaxID=63359 RepID=A0AAP0S6N6_LIQFO